MAISDKLTYLNETKTQLKDMINYGLDNNNKITNQTTFRNYVSSTFKAFIESLNNPNTLWSNLPKINGEGKEITLNNTIEAPMKLELNPSELEQETTTGKNLFEPKVSGGQGLTATLNDDGSIHIQGTTTGTWANITTNTIHSLPSGNYTMSLKNALNYKVYFRVSFEDNTGDDNSISIGDTSKTITFPKNVKSYYLFLQGGFSSGDTINTDIYFQLEAGSSATSWEKYTGSIPAPNPSYEMPVHTISGDNEIKICNPNIWDEQWEQGYYDSTGNSVSSTNAIRSKNFIPVKPNTTYYFYNGESNNGRVNFYDINKTFISTNTIFNQEKTTPNNCYYILMSTGTSYGGTYLNNICINVSNTNINGTYYPHQEQVKEIDLRGNNLWDEQWVIGHINSDGNIDSAYTNRRTTTFINVNPNTTYYEASPDNAYAGRIAYYSKNKSLILFSNSGISQSDKTFTTPDNCYFVRITFGANYGTTYNNDIAIIKGTSGQYEPYNSIEYCEIGDYKDKFIRNSGKNLFDKATITDNKGILYANGNDNNDNNQWCSDYIEIEPNTNYYCNYKTYSSSYYGMAFYDENKTYISGNSLANITESFITPNNAKYLRFSCSKQSGYTTNIDTLMLNKGTTSLPYEPYGSGQWYIKKNIGKVVLDGSEDEYWQLNTSGVQRNVYLCSLSNIYYKSEIISVYSNNFIRSKWDTVYNYRDSETGINTLCCAMTDNRIAILWRENGSNKYSVSDFKTWLSTHNTIVYYQLDTPTYTILNNTLQTQLEDIYNTMKSYNGQTNISQVNNDLAFNISSSAIEDIIG